MKLKTKIRIKKRKLDIQTKKVIRMQRHDIDRHETGANTTDSFTKSFICPPELSVGIKNQIL